MSDLIWMVSHDSWPTFDIDREGLLDLLDEFDRYYPGAVASLADARVPVFQEVGDVGA